MDYLLEGEEAFDAISSYAKNLFVPFEGNDYRPWFLQSKILMYVVVFLLIAKIITIGFFLPFPKNFFFADITKIDLLNLLNQNREEYGLAPLTQSNTLDQAAELKARDMIAHGYFSHESPSGVSPWFWFKQAGYEYKYAGENLAVGFADSSVVYNAWFNSSSHKDNLLNKNYKEVGTAIVQGFGANGSMVVVQLFGSPLVAATPPTQSVVNNTLVTPAQPKPVAVQEPVNSDATEGANVETNEQPLVNNEAPVNENAPVPARVLGGSTEHVLSEPGDNAKDSLYVKFLNFIVYNNNQILQVLSYGLLAIVSICLVINIGINFEIQRKDLIIRSLILIGILYMSTFIDKDIILPILPYQVSI